MGVPINISVPSDIEEVASETTDTSKTKTKTNTNTNNDIEESKESASIANTYATKNSQTSKNSSKHSDSKSKSGISLAVQSVAIQNAIARLDEEDEDPDARKTQLCFGSCCDVRRATIIVNVFSIPLVLLSIYSNIQWSNEFEQAGEVNAKALIDVDELNQLADMYVDDFGTMVEEDLRLWSIKCGISIIFGIVGILGACFFSKWLVLMTAVWIVVDIVFSCIFGRFVFLLFIFFLYPHVVLFRALHKGKMTKDNYVRREKHCCCCDTGANKEDSSYENDVRRVYGVNEGI